MNTTPEIALLDQAHSTLVNLLRQRGRQEDMEEASSRGSYPHSFPDWEQAWEQARRATWDIEKYLIQRGDYERYL